MSEGNVHSVGGIILAAGASSRMGRPKALLPWGRSSCVEEIARAFGAIGLEAVVVTPPGALGEEIAARVSLVARATVNPEPNRGMLSSLQCGAEFLLAQGLHSALVCPVDQPQVSVALCQELAMRASVGLYAVSAHQGSWGHPYALASLHHVIDLEEGQQARTLLERHQALLVEAGPEVLLNVNTEEAYQDALTRFNKEQA